MTHVMALGAILGGQAVTLAHAARDTAVLIQGTYRRYEFLALISKRRWPKYVAAALYPHLYVYAAVLMARDRFKRRRTP